MDRLLEQIDYETLRAAALRARAEAAEAGRERPRKIRRRPRDPEKVALLRMICEDYCRRWPPLWWHDEAGQWCVRCKSSNFIRQVVVRRG
jgi:hypothetical protein